MIEILSKYWPSLFHGAMVTLMVSILSWVIGILFGFAFGMAFSRSENLRRSINSISFIFSSIPALVILFWFHYPAQAILGLVIDPFITTIFVLALLNTIYVADIVSFSASRLSMEYFEVAFICGWERTAAFKLIDLPLIIRASAGRIISTQVLILHMSLFASMISLDELFRSAQRINSLEYRPVEIYTILALFYFVLSAPLLALSSKLNKKYGRDFSER
ncbi:MAG: ABC transporter permease subunit [Proteobacteria bacterium]|nr:ABC transporter permease subunit [Pseudomonadota bacterium]